jgi:hypothetical protein
MRALAVLELADLAGEGDHHEGATLTLRREWQEALERACSPHTGASDFQPPRHPTEEVESEVSLCASSPDGEVDPWA